MGKTFYLSYFILVVILAQGITSLLEENFEKSSYLHVRRKRVIDRKQLRGREISIHYAPYIVNINRNGVSHCAGVILSLNIVLTAAHCLDERNVIYTVLSGSSLLNAATKHIIQKKIIHIDYNPRNLMNDLALFKVSPNIRLGTGFNRAAELYNSVIVPGTLATFSGWGCTSKIPLIFPKKLIQTELPIMHRRYCQEHYRSRNIHILDQHVCAFDRTGNRGSCTGDDGGPLIVDGNKLVGIFSYRNGDLNGRNPEVFMNVADHEIQTWILKTIRNNSNWYGFGLQRGFAVQAHRPTALQLN